MPSDRDAPRRLHPASVVFNLAREVKAFGVPALLLIFGAGSSDEAWRLWGALLIVPASVAAIARYFSFTYTYGPTELIVRSGIFFKRERHIPYSRIQNIDATQNIAHALFGVYAVALETGSGAEAEATLSVMPEAALNEMRGRVREEQGAAAPEAPAAGSAAEAAPVAEAPPDVLLRLGLRDLAICGLVRGRGLLLLGAIVGLAFEFGLDDALTDTADDPESRGPLATAVRSAIRGLSFDVVQVIAVVVLFTAVVLMLRLLSVLYTMQRLYGFSLVHASGELRMTYGSLTRVRATIPLRRIQTVSVREGPLHRLFGVSSVRADTAGGEANQRAAGSREWLAPVIPRTSMPEFVRTLMPGAAVEAVDWQPPHPRAVRRACVRHAAVVLVFAAALYWYAGWLALPWLALGVPAAFLHARQQIRHMGHALISGQFTTYNFDSRGFFLFKSGWIWRQVTVAPVGKVQAVALVETPFDRRHGMAALVVDTAGARGAPHRLDVPYLDRAAAASVAAAIAASAAGSTFNW